MSKTPKKEVSVRYDDKGITTYYANIAQVRTNPYDVEIIMGRVNVIDENEEKRVLNIEDPVRIIMSKEHAVAFFNALKENLISNGVIRKD